MCRLHENLVQLHLIKFAMICYECIKWMFGKAKKKREKNCK